MDWVTIPYLTPLSWIWSRTDIQEHLSNRKTSKYVFIPQKLSAMYRNINDGLILNGYPAYGEYRTYFRHVVDFIPCRVASRLS